MNYFRKKNTLVRVIRNKFGAFLEDPLGAIDHRLRTPGPRILDGSIREEMGYHWFRALLNVLVMVLRNFVKLDVNFIATGITRLSLARYSATLRAVIRNLTSPVENKNWIFFCTETTEFCSPLLSFLTKKKKLYYP